MRFEPKHSDGEFTRIARMRDLAHIAAGNLIPYFGQFRTALRSLSHFLVDMEAVAFGP